MSMLLPRSEQSLLDNAVSLDEGIGELHRISPLYHAVLMLHALVAAGRQKKRENTRRSSHSQKGDPCPVSSKPALRRESEINLRSTLAQILSLPND